MFSPVDTFIEHARKIEEERKKRVREKYRKIHRGALEKAIEKYPELKMALDRGIVIFDDTSGYLYGEGINPIYVFGDYGFSVKGVNPWKAHTFSFVEALEIARKAYRNALEYEDERNCCFTCASKNDSSLFNALYKMLSNLFRIKRK